MERLDFSAWINQRGRGLGGWGEDKNFKEYRVEFKRLAEPENFDSSLSFFLTSKCALYSSASQNRFFFKDINNIGPI